MSKRIKKCIRNKTRAKRKEAIQQIFETFSGIKNISQIKSARKKTLILKTKNEKGETVTSRKGIANVIGEFHSKLHDEEREREMTMESMIMAEMKRTKDGEDKRARTR